MGDLVQIYSDGACIPNPGRAAWCAILTYNGHEKVLSGILDGRQTNNVAELTAALKGIEAVKENYSGQIEVITDSQYVVNIMNGEWDAKANHELIGQIKRLPKFHLVKWMWVRGHSGNAYNERADSIANGLALGQARQYESAEAIRQFESMMNKRKQKA